MNERIRRRWPDKEKDRDPPAIRAATLATTPRSTRAGESPPFYATEMCFTGGQGRGLDSERKREGQVAPRYGLFLVSTTIPSAHCFPAQCGTTHQKSSTFVYVMLFSLFPPQCGHVFLVSTRYRAPISSVDNIGRQGKDL